MAVKPAVADRQITIGDNSYTLRFSVRAMAALQDHYQLPSLTAVGAKLQDSDNLSITDMVAMLWAGLRTYHPEITFDEALGMLDDMGIENMQSVLGDAMQGAMPDADPNASADAGGTDGDPQ